MLEIDLPPGEKWQTYELQASCLRDFARIRIDLPLDPFALARFANLLVVNFDDIKGLSEKTCEHLLGTARESWSGGACALPNGLKLVVLNPAHGRARTNATLMEEICHVFLGHEPNRIGIVVRDARGKVTSRDYKKDDEEAAYAVGAAVLVPYSTLRRWVYEGKPAEEIARRLRVSRELVEYRIKVTRLWRSYKSGKVAHEEWDKQHPSSLGGKPL